MIMHMSCREAAEAAGAALASARVVIEQTLEKAQKQDHKAAITIAAANTARKKARLSL